MIGLDDLYQDLILDHAKNPKNFGEPEECMHDCYQQSEGYNPLCGDKVQIWLLIEDGKIADIKFSGKACAICTASASLMTDALRGRPETDAVALFDMFHDLLTEQAEPEAVVDEIGELAALQGVLKFPMRVKCATLPLHSFKAALDKFSDKPATEE